MDLFAQKEREISCLTVSVDKNTAEQMKSLILDFKRRLFTMMQENSHSEEVYQINFQFFPLTKKDDGEET